MLDDDLTGIDPNIAKYVALYKRGAATHPNIAKYVKLLEWGKVGDAWELLIEDIDAATDPDAPDRLLDCFAAAQRLVAAEPDYSADEFPEGLPVKVAVVRPLPAKTSPVKRPSRAPARRAAGVRHLRLVVGED